jgi:hypothetical protein
MTPSHSKQHFLQNKVPPAGLYFLVVFNRLPGYLSIGLLGYLFIGLLGAIGLSRSCLRSNKLVMYFQSPNYPITQLTQLKTYIH